MATVQYLSGAQAIKQGIITEFEWAQALAHPWAWCVFSRGVRIREIPWQGLEIRTDEPSA